MGAVTASIAHRSPLVAHIIYKLDVGGLENGLVNLINHMQQDRYRHAVICLTESTEFRDRIKREDVEVYCLRKREGQDPAVYWRLWKLLRHLRPDIVHTRNLATLECLLPSALAGVRRRVHGEHGRDLRDPDGMNPKFRLLRKLHRPLVHRYVALSQEMVQWLAGAIGVRPPARIKQIYNGVDVVRYSPGARSDNVPAFLWQPGVFVVGTVGRMQGEKDHLTLVEAFCRLTRDCPERDRKRLRLALIGDGPLHQQAADLLKERGLADLAWLPGRRDDVAAVMRLFDVFVLPSLAEGVSNTILEAMATGLPVVATDVGGTPELVDDGTTGTLVEPGDPEEMSRAIRRYLDQPDLARQHGEAGRRRVEREFSLSEMVASYQRLYDELLGLTEVRETTEKAIQR